MTEGGNYNPYEERWLHTDRFNRKPLSDLGACANLLKCIIGSGVLAYPWAFYKAGLITGVLMTCITGLCFAHCYHILVSTSQACCKLYRFPILSYSETVEIVILHGPECLQKFSKCGKYMVDILLFFTYTGIVSVYVVFLSTIIQSVLDYEFNVNWSITTTTLLLVIPTILVSQIRELKYVVPASITAFAFSILTYLIVFYYCLKNGLHFSADLKLFPGDFMNFTEFFGVIVFSMEAIGIVMPIENRMTNPEHFTGNPGIICVTMSIVVILYNFIGIIGYATYGAAVETSITLNFPHAETVSRISQAAVVISIFLTIAVVFFVAYEILWRLTSRFFPEKRLVLAQVGIRLVILLYIFVNAMVVPKLDLIMDLTSAVLVSMVGLIIPLLMHTIFNWEDLGRFNWMLFKNCAVILFAVVGSCSAFFVAARNLSS